MAGRRRTVAAFQVPNASMRESFCPLRRCVSPCVVYGYCKISGVRLYGLLFVLLSCIYFSFSYQLNMFCIVPVQVLFKLSKFFLIKLIVFKGYLQMLSKKIVLLIQIQIKISAVLIKNQRNEQNTMVQ